MGQLLNSLVGLSQSLNIPTFKYSLKIGHYNGNILLPTPPNNTTNNKIILLLNLSLLESNFSFQNIQFSLLGLQIILEILNLDIRPNFTIFLF